MRNLIRFVLRYNFPILFVVFEIVAIIFVFNNNPIQRGRVANKVNSLSSIFYDKTFQLTQYMQLRKANEQMAKESSFLRSLLTQSLPDSATPGNGYEFIPARVINNSVNKEYNYLTLNVGSEDGVEPDMAVVSPFGIVGIIKAVTPNYSRVISVLNSQLRISVKMSKSGHFGSMNWNGRNYRDVMVTEIPSHLSLQEGDSIVTSGYSLLFPPNELVATVIEAKPAAGGNFLEVRARLCNDFKQLSTVYIVRNLMKEEIQTLEGENDEE